MRVKVKSNFKELLKLIDHPQNEIEFFNGQTFLSTSLVMIYNNVANL